MRRLVTYLLTVLLLGAVAAPAAAQDPATTDELLPGMVTEEVEPGVYRVINDGVRDLAKANTTDIVVGHDGGIWLLRPKRFFRLGDDEWLAWATKKPKRIDDFEVAPDGTVWMAGWSFDGRSWTNPYEEDDRYPFEVTPDGTLWAMWRDSEQEGEDAAFSLAFGYLDAEEWQALGHLSDLDIFFPGSVLVASADDIWARTRDFHGPVHLVWFVDGAWQVELDGAVRPLLVALGPDGTLWSVISTWEPGVDSVELARFDGDEWNRWSLLDTGFGPGAEEAQFEVAPDGSVWFGVRAGPLGGSFRSCDGISRFDGETWDRYLSGLCVRAIDVTADGAVWLLAKEPMAGLRQVYVITPEAVSAAK